MNHFAWEYKGKRADLKLAEWRLGSEATSTVAGSRRGEAALAKSDLRTATADSLE